MRNIFIVFILFIATISAQAQKSDSLVSPFIVKHKYLNFLLLPDSNSKATLLNIRLSYLFTPPRYPFRRGGFSYEVGLNLARFFSKKFILGITYESKVFAGGFTKQHFSREFVNDFNNNFITEYSNSNDSLRASIFYNGINGVNNNYVVVAFPEYFGISFSPFPQKWGGFMLTVKKGGTSYFFNGNYDAKSLDPNKENSILYLQTFKNIAFDLSFKPYKFFTNENVTPFNSDKFNYWGLLLVSLCCDRFSFASSEFNYQSINTFVRKDFITKYSNKYYFGIKLSVYAY